MGWSSYIRYLILLLPAEVNRQAVNQSVYCIFPNMTVTPFRVGWLVLSACLYTLLGYTTTREQFPMLLGFSFLLFWGYLLRIQPLQTTADTDQSQPDLFLIGSAIGFRLLLVLATPQLSDDYFRFIWDGTLLANGFSPYLYLPNEIINSVPGLDEALFQRLNSPGTYTTYLPLNQAFFGLAALLSPNNLVAAIVYLRLPVLLAEVGSLWLLIKLLKKFNQHPNLALLYGLNPLVILEFTGNIHYESVALFLCLLALWLLIENRWVLSAGAFALASSSTWMVLIFIPLLIRVLGWRRGLSYSIIALGFASLLFLPFANSELVEQVLPRIESPRPIFNASVYYLCRSLGWFPTALSSLLALLTLTGIVWVSWRRKNEAVTNDTILWANRALGVATIYLVFALEVQPWQVITLIVISVFSRFRFPLVWSASILLSYAAYQTVPYRENLWFTAFEYSVVAVFAWREYAQKA